MSKKAKDVLGPNDKTAKRNDEILVVTSEPGMAGVRGGGVQPLKVEELSTNITIFVQQVGRVLESTPETVGKFHFDEVEIHAEISADGTIAILGSGVHAGVAGGLRFIFRRSSE